MMFNATFNNTSVILWTSVLLVEENRISQVTDKLLSHVELSTPCHEQDTNSQLQYNVQVHVVVHVLKTNKCAQYAKEY